MKKFKLLLSMLMLVCFSVGTWAADYELVYTLDGSVTTGGNSSYAADGGGLTQDGIDWSVTGNTTINPWRIGGRSLTNEDRLAYSKTAISDNIAKIEIEHGNITLTANSVKVEVASKADFSTILQTFTTTTVEANKTITYLRPSGQDWSNAYYRITYNVTAGSSNAYVQLKSVKFYKEKAASTTPSISIEQNGSAVTSVDFGEVPTRNTDPDDDNGTTQTIDVKASNLTGDVYLQIDNTDGNYYYIYDPRYASAYFAYYTLKPKDGAIDTSLVLDVTSWDATGTMTGKLKVSSKASTPDFTAFNIDLKVNIFELKPGDYDINLNNTFFGVATGTNAEEQSGSLKCIELVSGCGSSATTKPYYDAAHVRFYKDAYLKICAPEGYVIDTILFTSGGTWNGEVSANVGKYDDTKKEWTGAFRCVTFDFGAQDRISKAKVSIIKAPKVGLPIISGQTPFYPSTKVTLSCETDGALMHYTTGEDDPTGGDQTYSEPFTLTETKTVKVIAIKNTDVSEIASKTFTKATPKTVAQAIALIPNNQDTENDQFVVGYVCTASESEPSNGQMTYYISDDATTDDEGTTTTDRIQIYKGKGLNNTDFSAASDLAVGDKVVVYGQLKNYNGVYELNSGNYIVEYTKRELKAVGVSGKLTQTEYDYGDQLNVAGLKATAYYTVGADVDITNDPGLVWTKEGEALSESLVYGGNSFVQASYGGKTSTKFDITTTVKTYALTFSAPSNGTLVIKDALSQEIKSGDKFHKNASLTVSASPATGYKLDKVTVLMASDDSDVTSEVLTYNKNLKMPNYAIKVSASFTKISYGKLEITPNKIDYGVVKVGATVTNQAFTLKCSGFTKGDLIKIKAPDGFVATTTSFGIENEDGSREYGYIFINPTSTTLGKAGVYDGNVVISSDGMAADSIVPVKLTVGGVVTTTPSPVALDLGDVLYKDELTQYSKSFHLKITNLTVGQYDQVVLNFLGSDYYAFGVNGNSYITDDDQDGVIDTDVKIKPSSSVMDYSFDKIAGQHTATIQFMPTSGTSSVATTTLGTVTMNIVAAYGITVADITGGKLTWNGENKTPKVAKEDATFTLAAVPDLGYKDGVIKVMKAADESDITSTVLKNGVLTMPAYAIKISVTFTNAGPAFKVDKTAIDFGTVAKKTSISEDAMKISMLGANLTGEVKVTAATVGSTSVFVTNGFKPSGYYEPTNGVIDATVLAIPYTNTVGDFTGSLTFHSEEGDFEDQVVSLHIKVTSDPGIAWAAAKDTTYTVGLQRTPQALTNPNKVTVSYSSSDQTVATIASDGTITPLKQGTTTIKASFAGNADYEAKDVTYVLQVYAPYKIKLEGTQIKKEFESGDYFYPATDGNYTVTAFYGEAAPVIRYDVTSEVSWDLDGYDIATKQITGTGQMILTATWQGLDHWVYIETSIKKHKIYFSDPDNGTMTIKRYGTAIASGTEGVKGHVFDVTVTPKDGYKLGTLKANGVDIMSTKKFTMGTEDVTVVATCVVGQVESQLAWSKTSQTMKFSDRGERMDFPTLTNPNEIPWSEITLSSSDPTVAEFGTPTHEYSSWFAPVARYKAGTTTMTATFAGNDDYKATTISYTLTIEKGDLAESEFRWDQYPDITYVKKDTFTFYESHSYASVVASKINKNTEVTYESTNTNVATVSTNGTPSAKAAGTTTIKAIFAGNDRYNAKTIQYDFTVKKASPVLSWNYDFSGSSYTYTYGETSYIPGFKSVTPGGLRESVKFSSSNPAIATIDPESGYVSRKNQGGTTTIRAYIEETEYTNAAEIKYDLTVVPLIELAPSGADAITMASQDAQYKDYATTISLTKATHQFSIKVNGAFFQKGVTFTRANTSYKIDGYYGTKISVNADVAGDYTFTWNNKDSVLSVVFPVKPSINVGATSIDFGTAYKNDQGKEEVIALSGVALTKDVVITTATTEGSTDVFTIHTNGDYVYSRTYGATAFTREGGTTVAIYASTYVPGEFSGKVTFHSTGDEFEDVVVPLHFIVKAKPTITLEAHSPATLVVKNNGVAIKSGDAVPEGTVLTVEVGIEAGSEDYYKVKSLTANGEDIMESKQFTVGTSDVKVIAWADQKAVPDFTWDKSGKEVRLGALNNVFPTMSNPNNFPLIYSSTKTDVATIDSETGEVTLVGLGTTYIKAYFAGNNDYRSWTSQYELIVKEGPVVEVIPTSVDFGTAYVNQKDESGKKYVNSSFTLVCSNLTNTIRLTAATTGGGSIFKVNEWAEWMEIAKTEINQSIPVQASTNTNTLGDVYGTITITSKSNPAEFAPVVVDLHVTIVEEGTGMEQVEAEMPARKVLIDGQLFILRGGKIYDAAGLLVK